MKYRLHKDPLFLFCAALYCANRWILKPAVSNEICRSYLNDLICIPFCVPIMVGLLRRVGLRRDDGPPRPDEVLIPLVLWAFVFEVLLPRLGPFRGLVVADPLDIVCYAAGALVATVFWNRALEMPPWRSASRPAPPP